MDSEFTLESCILLYAKRHSGLGGYSVFNFNSGLYSGSLQKKYEMVLFVNIALCFMAMCCQLFKPLYITQQLE